MPLREADCLFSLYRDGYYSAAGMEACKPCPNGTYASVQRDLRDFLRCPNATSPRLALPTGVAAACPSTVESGAVSCRACPPDRPYTWTVASTDIGKCVPCPPEHYLDSATKKCVQCVAPCHTIFSANSFYYELVPCTPSSKRQCALCDTRCTGVDEFALQVREHQAFFFLLLHSALGWLLFCSPVCRMELAPMEGLVESAATSLQTVCM